MFSSQSKPPPPPQSIAPFAKRSPYITHKVAFGGKSQRGGERALSGRGSPLKEFGHAKPPPSPIPPPSVDGGEVDVEALNADLVAAYYAPLLPPLAPVEEVLFLLHAVDKPIPDPLPPWAGPWVLRAHRFGGLLANNRLRTRDIYGLEKPESVFETNEFVVYVPKELNPFLVRSVSAPQRLFRLGYQEMPSTEQIVQLPLSAGDYINPYFAEDDPDYQS